MSATTPRTAIKSVKGRFSLQTRRFIPASPARVFAAWTDPAELRKWWGPAHVRCVSAEIDLRIGGRYRIGNELPDRSIVWIEGVFERIESPALRDRHCLGWAGCLDGLYGYLLEP